VKIGQNKGASAKLLRQQNGLPAQPCDIVAGIIRTVRQAKYQGVQPKKATSPDQQFSAGKPARNGRNYFTIYSQAQWTGL
jgi:hypothetical protein